MKDGSCMNRKHFSLHSYSNTVISYVFNHPYSFTSLVTTKVIYLPSYVVTSYISYTIYLWYLPTYIGIYLGNVQWN
jgi:hypothetical protein